MILLHIIWINDKTTCKITKHQDQGLQDIYIGFVIVHITLANINCKSRETKQSYVYDIRAVSHENGK